MRLQTVLLTTTVLLVIGGVTGWLFWRPTKSEPVYQGKPLRFWLTGFATGPQVKDAEGRNVTLAREALKCVGTNAIPTLLRLAQQKPRWFRSHLNRIALRFHLIWLFHADFMPPHLQAFCGFQALGSSASNAVPALLGLYDRGQSSLNPDQLVSIFAAFGPTASEATPRILEQLKSATGISRRNAIFALASIHSYPRLVVPILVQCLADPNSLIGYSAALGLAEFGPDAEAAVPSLVALLQDRNEMSIVAAEALKEIDPSAAAKADVRVYDLFSTMDFTPPGTFVNRVTLQMDSVSVFLGKRLSEAPRDDLAEYLIRELNEIIRGPCIYDAQRFAGVTLRPETQKLLASNPHGAALIRLNRLLIEDAYPNEIVTMRSRGPPRLDILAP